MKIPTPLWRLQLKIYNLTPCFPRKIKQNSSKRESRKKEKGLEIICKQTELLFSRRLDREQGNTRLLFPFAFNSRRLISWVSFHESKLQYIWNWRQGMLYSSRKSEQGNLALQSCRATASRLLKKGLGICKEYNIHRYTLLAKMCCKHYYFSE